MDNYNFYTYRKILSLNILIFVCSCLYSFRRGIKGREMYGFRFGSGCGFLSFNSLF